MGTYTITHILFIIGLTAVLIYVMPSNGAFVVGIGLFYIKDKRLVLALGAGCALAVPLYAPLIPGILSDPQIQAHGSRMRILTESIPEVFNAFVSYRWLLIPIIILGLYYHRSRFFYFTLGITIISIVLFILNGSYLYARVLFPLLPLWCIVTAESIDNVFSHRRFN
jgi:hypothetical protein